MKKFYVILISIFYCGSVLGQKEGNIWMSGDKSQIKFRNDTAVSLKRKDHQLFWRTSASICDSNGNLLFYTNGFRVYNRFGKIMQNGDSLALGDYISYGYGLNDSPDGAVIIPAPGMHNLFFLFYSDLNFIHTVLGDILYPTHLMYAKVDMDLDNGLGGIVSGEKNVVILSDTLTQCVMQAVKQSSGKDWWLICHEYGSNRYYKYSISNTGITGPFTQSVGGAFQLQNAQVASPMKFSRDGNEFLHLSFDSNRVELYNFDRCSGELYNHRAFKVDTNFAYSYGASFSPSGRYIYVSVNFDEIRQYDTWEDDITKSMKIVGIDNGVKNPFPANYYLQQLGADGKIYISGYDFDNALHVINDPDIAGIACNFVEWGFPLIRNTDWGGGTPNIPNYNLEAVEGCDSIITNSSNLNPETSSRVQPNPCDGKFQLSITGVNSKTEVVIYNEMGEVIEQSTLQPVNGFIHGFFNLQNEPAGVYLLKVHTNRGDISMKVLKE